MSAPTSQFHGLSIGGINMAETEAEIDADAVASSGRTMHEQTMKRGNTSRELSAVRAGSGIVYDLSRSELDIETRARALLGLTTEFDMLSCCASRTGYDFVFGERIRVHIDLDLNSGSNVNANGNLASCTCAVFRGRPDVACQHIFWLLDQLQGQFVSSHPPPPGILLLPDGHAPAFTRIERCLLDGPAKLEDLAERLNWPYIRTEIEGGMSRTQRVRDIISAFSTDVLPEEFPVDLVEDDEGMVSQQRTPEQCVVQGDFKATIFRLAVHDDNVYTSLCKAMPPGACAAIYFDKIQERSRKVLAAFDRYCQTYGGNTSTTTTKQATVAIYNILDHLRTDVHQIQTNILLRTPHGTQVAAKALISLLEDISTRNKDALDSNNWGVISFDNEDEDQRNIYHQLIGRMDEDETDIKNYFILDSLEYLTGEELYQFRDRLRAILHKIEVNRAPRGYILKLGGIIRAAEGALTSASGVGISALGRKRYATGVDGVGGEGEGVVKRLR